MNQNKIEWLNNKLIYCPSGENGYDVNTFMTPHPMLLNDNVIRIYGGVRDNEGVSRITYIDVEASNPQNIISVASEPALDIGNPGCFDDNGVILGDIVKVKNQLYMYYVGFQHVQKAKFYAFSGLAVSDLNGKKFKRVSEVPIMDRTDTGKFGRCIHSVLFEDNIFKIYYAVIHSWHFINGIPYPAYNIWYTESKDGKTVANTDPVFCIDVNPNEYRIGRPKVYKTDNGYEMFYTRDFVTKDYVIGYAVSQDGKNWKRADEFVNLNKCSEQLWYSEMACYPTLLKYKNKEYVFYNGNGMGKTGVGFAELQRK